MPATKITGLTAISTIDTAVDPLPIVDVSDTTMAASGTTKKVTVDQILGAGAAGSFSSVSASGAVSGGSLNVTGVASFADGTVALPSITNTGDTNTGVYFPDADTVAVTAGGTESFRVDSSRNVLVNGTTAATFTGVTPKLQVQAASGDASIGVKTSNQGIALFSDSAIPSSGINCVNYGFGSPAFRIRLSGTDRYVTSGVVVNNEAHTFTGGDASINGIWVGRGQSNVASNVAIGVAALGTSSTSGTQNVAIGSNAADTLTSGSDNIAIGNNALGIATTASSNIAIGSGALDTTVTGGFNVAIGQNALGACTGTNNTVIGYGSGPASGSYTQNCFFGLNSGFAGDDNCAFGVEALTANTASQNCAFGGFALRVNTSGSNSTAIGYSALDSQTTGGANTAVGWQSGETITTGIGNTLLGSNTQAGAVTANGRLVLGKGVTGTGNNRITVGVDSNLAELDLDGADTSWAASSDERLKKNIQTLTAGLGFITSLRPVSFDWRTKREVDPSVPGHADSDEPVHGESGKSYHGFIAQEVKQAIDAHPEVVTGQHFWELRENGIQTLAPADLVPILVNCIKELSSRVTALENA
jgi:hypothetical protein